MIHRIELCGGIASGKTTLANLLTRLRIKPVLENFQSNPFWQAFYADPIGTAFETEITFLLQHYHQIKTAQKLENKTACDFSLLLDQAYARVTLSQDKLQAFLAVYQEVNKELPPASLLIYLRCNPEIELDRIRHRGRRVENSITIEYLQQINMQLERLIADYSDALFVVDSGQLDFANNENVKKYLLEQIEMKVSSTLQF
ncbi:deoxynucleoside kinase [Nitrosomonas halophila]|uniref:Deoxyadenosine/deoxycytidine kinase n=1 Tax=Nitrosomonas halophila TaxID=44576 RepID=A0A1H3DRV9_9PROT|nr:deoxynucleoside kinase [Nitrosomonas halophila]SDX69253.1 Deoxyadenosine/deoxycytidine kinase [Nitrosomonas halophila]